MKKLLSLVIPVLFNSVSFAQNIGIGTTTPNASAILKIKAASKGL